MEGNTIKRRIEKEIILIHVHHLQIYQNKIKNQRLAVQNVNL